jgi:hypothetical protein
VRDVRKGAEQQASEHLRLQELGASRNAGCLHRRSDGGDPGVGGRSARCGKVLTRQSGGVVAVAVEADPRGPFRALTAFLGGGWIDADHRAAKDFPQLAGGHSAGPGQDSVLDALRVFIRERGGGVLD